VPPPPFVSALSQSKLSVTWPAVDGFNIADYEVYMDSSSLPVILTNNLWTAAGLVAGSTHSFRLAFQLTDGRRSALSEPATGTTWGEDNNLDGLPDDWQGLFWGDDPSKWPAPTADSDGDGATNLQEFLAGTDPTDASNVLRVQMIYSSQGSRLNWNSRPGFVYRVQESPDLVAGSWTNVGRPRFSAGVTDSILVNATVQAAYYRVLRMR